MIYRYIKNIFHYFLISNSGLFDRRYYLETYPDVRDADIDPLWHFVTFGWKEGRNPNEKFCTKDYLALNPDVAIMNPLIHYIKFGIREDRRVNFSASEQIPYDYNDLSVDRASLETLKDNANNPPRKIDIIIFPIIDWYFRFQRPQQLAKKFAELGHRVFYLATAFNHFQAPVVKKVEDNIYLVQLYCSNPTQKFCNTIPDNAPKELEGSIEILRKYYQINSAVMMVDAPFWQNLVIPLKKAYGWKLIYDCMDLHKGFSTSNERVARHEELILKESDLVLVTSDYLYRHVKNDTKNVILVPNGTDFDFFHQAVQLLPVEEFKSIQHPIIGYYGAIADWFDTDLVGELARRHQNWSFVLIGKTALADLRPLHNLPNIYLMGEKPYGELPGYLSQFDVCIIPFKDTPLTNATNPVKLYEFLSAGKPVVATRLEELSKYDDHVRLVTSIEEWDSAISDCIFEPPSFEILAKQFEFAKENTWQKRADKIISTTYSLFPKISIILVTYNNLEYTKLCLESIFKNTPYPNYEVVIVDNASEDEMVSYLKEYSNTQPNVILELNHENLGFAPANNQGVRKSQGKYLIFLNNDTIVTPGWMDKLYLHLVNTESAGMVGPVTNSIGNEAKIFTDYTELDEINLVAAKQAIKHAGEMFEIRVLALYCCIISRELFEKVGGLDERYKVGMFEDDDLAMKIHAEGLKLFCAEDVFIHHFHGASFNKIKNDKYQEIFEKNKEEFEKKWATVWQPHKYRN